MCNVVDVSLSLLCLLVIISVAHGAEYRIVYKYNNNIRHKYYVIRYVTTCWIDAHISDNVDNYYYTLFFPSYFYTICTQYIWHEYLTVVIFFISGRESTQCFIRERRTPINCRVSREITYTVENFSADFADVLANVRSYKIFQSKNKIRNKLPTGRLQIESPIIPLNVICSICCPSF